jgi:hypothetical protein
LSASSGASSGARSGEESGYPRGGASSPAKLENEPRDIALNYFSKMKNDADTASKSVKLWIRVSKRPYSKPEYACQAVREEIDVEENKPYQWVVYFQGNSRFDYMYKGAKEKINQHCEDIEKCLIEIDKILSSPDTYNIESLSEQLSKLGRYLENCKIIAQREIDTLRQ